MFLPFSGCPVRCIFCSQSVQTGESSGQSVPVLLDRAEMLFERRAKEGLPALELAFFGGTFTGQAPQDMDACLDFARTWRERGAVTKVRCSTRPDRVDLHLLRRLRGQGLDMVELGIQSFSDHALVVSGRNYKSDTARRACEMVREVGLELGIQLMPGMPGVERGDGEKDLEETLAVQPDCVRLYPCLVLEGTDLARLWREGRYTPWSLDDTLDYLAGALLLFWQAGIPVIRMGLAPEVALDSAILAGPVHPALGSRARSLALSRHVTRELAGLGYGLGNPMPGRLLAPSRCRGEFWGHKKELAPTYALFGLTPAKVRWWEREEFLVERE